MESKFEDEKYDGDDGSIMCFKEDEKQELEPDQKQEWELTSKQDYLWASIKKTLFILGSSVIVLVAVRNSLTQLMQNFWGASGSFWQHQYDQISEYFENDDFKIFFYGSMFVQYVMYWAVGIFYILMDLTLKPEFFRKYKIQPGTNEPVDAKRLLKVVALVHFNQSVVTGLGLLGSWKVLQWRGFDSSRQLPTFQWVVFELVLCILVEEIAFYYSHRLFHHRLFYKHFHKLHHEWQSPISVSAIYAHPVEHFFANFGPVILGPLLLGSHPATGWLWVQLAQLSTLNAHCGYHLPFFPSPESHDYHHLKFNQCYGVLGILDLLHGTDQRFRSSSNWPRHVTSLSMQPLRVQFPDQVSVKKAQE